MKRMLWVVLTIAIAAAPAVAKKVQVDYDHGYDFSSRKTVAWAKGTPAANELNQKRIEDAVTTAIEGKGLAWIEAPTADLLVETHAVANTETKTSGGTVGLSVHKRTSWGSIGVGGGSGRKTKQVKVGTLMINVRDRASGELVWQATASDTLKGDVEDTARKIEWAVTESLKQFPPAPAKK